MKKKRALLLFGSITLPLLGYLAWCARTFYLSAPVPDLLDIPQPYRADAQALLVKHGFTRPDCLHADALLELLAHPYSSAPKGIISYGRGLPEEPIIMFHRERHCLRNIGNEITFIATEGKWQVEVLDGFTGRTIEDRELIPATP